MPRDCVCGDSNNELEDSLFESKNEIEQTFSKLCYGDFYIIGRLWIEALKTVLVGSGFCLIPVVKAASPPEKVVPQKPPKMRYTDLPLYESPYLDYQCYKDQEGYRPEYSTKIMESYLLPRVKSFRKQAEKTGGEMRSYIKSLKNDFCGTVKTTKADFKRYMRDPQNLQLRQVVVASGALTGLLLGKTIPRRLFLASIGTLATGALCFPKETDEGFRQSIYYTSQAALSVYNKLCNKNVLYLKDRIECEPPPPPPKK